jgi:hypothetical protein
MPRTRDPQTSLLALAERHFRTQVAGQAEGTVDAKQRDLACFLSFYTQRYGHDDRREWYKAVTEAFLKGWRGGRCRGRRNGVRPGPSVCPSPRSPARMRPCGTSPAGSTTMSPHSHSAVPSTE